MKKISLLLGTLGAIATPVVAVVSCGDKAPETKKKDTKESIHTVGGDGTGNEYTIPDEPTGQNVDQNHEGNNNPPQVVVGIPPQVVVGNHLPNGGAPAPKTIEERVREIDELNIDQLPVSRRQGVLDSIVNIYVALNGQLKSSAFADKAKLQTVVYKDVDNFNKLPKGSLAQLKLGKHIIHSLLFSLNNIKKGMMPLYLPGPMPVIQSTPPAPNPQPNVETNVEQHTPPTPHQQKDGNAEVEQHMPQPIQ